jgi:hypothetical protein
LLNIGVAVRHACRCYGQFSPQSDVDSVSDIFVFKRRLAEGCGNGMMVIETGIEGLKIIEPDIFHDARGSFAETYNVEWYAAHGIAQAFVQDDESCSQKGVVRGLRFDDPALGIGWQAVGAPLVLSEKDRSLPLSGISCLRRRRDVCR